MTPMDDYISRVVLIKCNLFSGSVSKDDLLKYFKHVKKKQESRTERENFVLQKINEYDVT